MNKEPSVLRFAFVSAMAVSILTIVTWGFAMMAVPPAGPYCPGDCMSYPFSDLLEYFPRDYYWMYMAIIQLFAYMAFIVSLHFIAPDNKKLFSFIGVSFGLIAVIVLLLAYYVQFSVVPASMIKGETEGIALITQYNGHGIFIAMEELGYITMSISFLFLSSVFSGKKGLEKSIRLLFILACLLSIISFIFYSVKFGIDRSYRFEVVVISVNWLVTISSGILISISLRKQLKANK